MGSWDTKHLSTESLCHQQDFQALSPWMVALAQEEKPTKGMWFQLSSDYSWGPTGGPTPQEAPAVHLHPGQD